METLWRQLSDEISARIAEAGRSVVAVDGRGGHTSSGIVWRSGFVITAAHTIREVGGIAVRFESNERMRAEVAGRAPGADIALLKVDGDLTSTPATFGDASAMRIGDLMVAVARSRRGNIVASSGILSGLMGEWQAQRTRIDQFIRPDLELYPGFSGGAVLGPDGKILGMATAGLLRGKPITIPASTLTRVAEELASKGRLSTPYVGLVMQSVQIPKSLQDAAGVKSGAGLLVMHVEPNGPADAAGALLGDILVSLGGAALDDLEDLQDVLLRLGIGQEVHATVIRGGRKADLAIRIGERPA
jgi:S1-C subfamily serine protease